MRPNLLILSASFIVLAALYFLFFSKSSWQNYNYLEKKIFSLEQQIEQLTLEKNHLLLQISNKDKIHTKEYYLNKKLIIRSNEMLVELQIPPLKNNHVEEPYFRVPQFLYILLLLFLITIGTGILFVIKKRK